MQQHAVVVSMARSPIGRAGKGSWKDMRPDDLTVRMVEAAPGCPHPGASRCSGPTAPSLGVDEDKFDVDGGAIAVGHPFGMTGAGITSTLVNSLQWHDRQSGLETMCVGGGQGMAMVLERLS